MANPFVRIIVNIVVTGVSVFSRAFVAAYHQALQNAKAGGAQAAKSASRSGIATDEALKILEVQKSDLLTNPVRIQQQFEKYLEQNDPAKGGSFYLQSKVFRAKEALDREMEAEKAKAGKAKAGGSGSHKE